MMDIRTLAKEQEAYVIECRRYLHQHPELSLKEVETTKFIVPELEKLDHCEIKTYEDMVKLQIEAIFHAFMEAVEDIEKAAASPNEAVRSFAKFYIKHPEPDCPPVRKVVDYIAGMTDTYANACFDELYRV